MRSISGSNVCRLLLGLMVGAFCLTVLGSKVSGSIVPHKSIVSQQRADVSRHKLAFIPNLGDDPFFSKIGIALIDTSTNNLISTIPLPNFSIDTNMGIAVASDGVAYITGLGYGGKTVVTVASAASMSVITAIPVPESEKAMSIALNEAAGYAYVGICNIFTGICYIGVINTHTNRFVKAIALGDETKSPVWMALNPKGNALYVSLASTPSGEIAKINTLTNTIDKIWHVGFGDYISGIAVNEAGTVLYVSADNNGGRVEVIDAQTTKVVKHIKTPGSPIGLVLNPGSSRLYAADSSGYVAVVDTSTNSIIHSIPVGCCPWGISMTHDGATVYVETAGPNALGIIDTASNVLAKTIHIGNQPIASGNFVQQ